MKAILLAAVLLLSGCGDTLPDDARDPAADCIRLNALPIPPTARDPHAGTKNVYVCHTATTRPPFPDGTLVVKQSTRPGESFPWLVATARKHAGAWSWDEYTRNFADEDLVHNLAAESVCTGCHVRARAQDWIFTRFDR
jgi:hypothetical protein